MSHQVFVGIDVSKTQLYVCVVPSKAKGVRLFSRSF